MSTSEVSNMKKLQLTRWLRPASSLVAGLVVASALTATEASAITIIDFEGLENGRIVNDQYSDLGVTIRGDNSNKNFVNKSPYDYLVAFDTSKNKNADPDLQADFYDFIQDDFRQEWQEEKYSFSGDDRDGDNGVIDPGNVLIIQENDYGCGDDGICNYPDDEGSRPAGFIEILFDMPVTLISIDFFDIEKIEDGQTENNKITLTTTGGEEIFYTPNTGGDFYYDKWEKSRTSPYDKNRRYNTWDRQFYNTAEVEMLRINMGGSGAIDRIAFQAAEVSLPATAALMLLGLVVLGRRPRAQASTLTA